MTKESRAAAEQRTLKLSLYGMLFFVVVSLVFALLTRSDAILFDGIYSFIGLCMVMLTFKVARLAERPDDEQFHFGYNAMEPTLNLFKSLIVMVTSIFALTGAVNRLLAGGNQTEYGLAVIYGLIATAGCFIIAWILHRNAEKAQSDLVKVESKTWLVDGLLSASVLAGFVIAWLLSRSDLSQYAPLVDPMLLILIVLLAIPIPGKIFLASLREVVGMAPPDHFVEEIEGKLLSALKDVDKKKVELRVNKRGRSTYLLVHVVVAEKFAFNDIDDLDRIRLATANYLQQSMPDLVMDMLFVRNPELAK